jgi:hypothetical protein
VNNLIGYSDPSHLEDESFYLTSNLYDMPPDYINDLRSGNKIGFPESMIIPVSKESRDSDFVCPILLFTALKGVTGFHVRLPNKSFDLMKHWLFDIVNGYSGGEF